MSAGIAIPVLIILGCGLLAAVLAFATRKKRPQWDIAPGPIPDGNANVRGRSSDGFDVGAEPSVAEDVNDPDDAANGTDDGRPRLELVKDPTGEHLVAADIAGSGHESLAAWHRLHESTVSAWIDNHQKVLAEINASGLQIDMGNRNELMAVHEELAPKMREAIASHPSPVMRAELSAMHVAGEATIFAVVKGDYETARRQHLVYVQYRDEWIERLQQFSGDPKGNLRSVLITTEFQLEEIRSAFETALDETDVPEEDDEAEFETPIIVREDSGPALDLQNQPEAAFEAAVGTPEDTTDDLEGGRLRRLLPRRPSNTAKDDE